jgi:hypothetical protein
MGRWLGAIALGGLGLWLLGQGACDAFGYLAGSPTTAKVVECHGAGASRSGASGVVASRVVAVSPGNGGYECTGAWNVGSQSQSGPIEPPVPRYIEAGTSLDVHVYGDTAYTPNSIGWWFLVSLIEGGGVLAAAVLVLGVLEYDRDTKSWKRRKPWKPWKPA